MRIRIVAVGKCKEKYWRSAIDEYSKRLSKYCHLELVEVEDEKTPQFASELEETKIKEKEAERILKHISSQSYVFVLAIEGQQRDSVQFSKEIQKLAVEGKSDITFVIGGSLGLHESVMKRGNTQISFSQMTFPHQLMRVVLLEQIYRGYRIANNEPYHK